MCQNLKESSRFSFIFRENSRFSMKVEGKFKIFNERLKKVVRFVTKREENFKAINENLGFSWLKHKNRCKEMQKSLYKGSKLNFWAHHVVDLNYITASNINFSFFLVLEMRYQWLLFKAVVRAYFRKATWNKFWFELFTISRYHLW